jgi:RimJ/RimL family protein N-acetyltransferase
VNRALPAVRLRVPTDEDAVAWHRLFDDPDVMEFHGGRSAGLSVYEELTARQRRHDAERGFCLWSVLDESGRVIGFTGAQPWEREWGPTGEIEIGWRLARAHWGRGYVTAAARLTLERVRTAGPQRALDRGDPAARDAAGGGVPHADERSTGALLPLGPDKRSGLTQLRYLE